MITNLLNSIAKAWIKAEQARKESRKYNIPNEEFIPREKLV